MLFLSAGQQVNLDTAKSLFQGEGSGSAFAEALACRCCFLWGSEPSGFFKKVWLKGYVRLSGSP